MTRVLIASPVYAPLGSLRRRILPYWLWHLVGLNTEDLDVRWCFVVDGAPGAGAPSMEREGHERLLQMLTEVFPTATIIQIADQGPWMNEVRSLRSIGGGGADNYRRMAMIRNLIRERALLEGVDYLFGVDSDVMVTRDTLRMLLAEGLDSGRPWVSALICNTPLEPHPTEPGQWAPCWAWNVMDFTADGRRHVHFKPDVARGGQCEATGAVCLYSYQLLVDVRWRPDPAGEDVGFGRVARAAGHRGWYIPHNLDHLMDRRAADLHVATCTVCRDGDGPIVEDLWLNRRNPS